VTHDDLSDCLALCVDALVSGAATWWISGGPIESVNQKRDKSEKRYDSVNVGITRQWEALNTVPLGDLFDDD
jgi:hypothetical protein